MIFLSDLFYSGPKKEEKKIHSLVPTVKKNFFSFVTDPAAKKKAFK